MYVSKSQQVENQRLKVQELSIPFRIIGSATPSAVSFFNELPGVLYIESEGANSNGAITAQDASASSLNAKLDGAGVFGLLVILGETVKEVQQASVSRRLAASGSPAAVNCWFMDADGITDNGNIALNVDSDLAVSAAGTGYYCLNLKYST